MPTRETIHGQRVGYRPLPPDTAAGETGRYEVQVAGQASAGIVACYLGTNHLTSYRHGQLRRTSRWRAVAPGGKTVDEFCTSRREAAGVLLVRQRHDALQQHMDTAHLIRYRTPVSMATLLADHRCENDRARSHGDKECDYGV